MSDTSDKKAAPAPTEKKETWINYLAFTTVIFAALATLSTFKGGGFSSRSVVFQAQASDQWAYFQAKSIRESLYRIQKENLSLQLGILPSTVAPEEKEKITQALAQADSKVEKYEAEKNDIEKAARALEQNRDEAQTHGKPLGLAVIFLQIAIVLSSIGGLLKRKEVWYLGLPIGLAGIILFADGFLLFLPANLF
jgi:flagellar basal body-associated protein FliL